MNIQGKLSVIIYAFTLLLASVSDASDPAISIVVLIMIASAAILAMWSGEAYKNERISEKELDELEKLIKQRKEDLDRRGL